MTEDPFLGPTRIYVSTPSHDEAVARLVATVESGQRRATLRADPGLGKSATLARAAAELRGPTRRVSWSVSPGDSVSLFSTLAEGLGRRVAAGAGRAVAWRTLADAVRVLSLQRLHAILVVDDPSRLVETSEVRELGRLVHLAPEPSTRLTVLLAVDASIPDLDDSISPSWELTITLLPLTRTETGRYVAKKLAAAGRSVPTFTPRAVSLLHELSGGVPRGLDRLASLALMAGAAKRLEVVPPEVVEGVARECSGPWTGYAA